MLYFDSTYCVLAVIWPSAFCVSSSWCPGLVCDCGISGSNLLVVVVVVVVAFLSYQNFITVFSMSRRLMRLLSL